jgi:hypothetical protein
VGLTPRKPTFSVIIRPSEPTTGLPSASNTWRSSSTGATRTSNRLPSRSTPRVTLRSGFARIAVRTWSQSLTGVPSNETMTSPGLSPAAAAGALGSASVHFWSSGACAGSTHWETLERRGVSSGIPKPVIVIVSSTTAMIRFIVGPPSMITSRCRTGRV